MSTLPELSASFSDRVLLRETYTITLLFSVLALVGLVGVEGEEMAQCRLTKTPLRYTYTTHTLQQVTVES